MANVMAHQCNCLALFSFLLRCNGKKYEKPLRNSSWLVELFPYLEECSFFPFFVKVKTCLMNNKILEDRYINPYTDFGFKVLFGTEINKDLLISFVNSLLGGKENITDLTYLNTEHLGTSEADRRAVFDVYCENDRGEKILIEMQRGEQQFFKDRSIYYSTFPIREQGRKGEWNYELKAVYVIGILNFTFNDESPEYFHHSIQLMDVNTKEVFYDKLSFVYLEMPKFNKKEEELEGMFDKWLFVLRNLSRLMERPRALQERIFTKLFEAAEIARFTREQYEAYEDSLKVYRDWQNTIATAKNKSHAEGRAEGIAETNNENALKMKKLGISAEIISQVTGLPLEEINKF